MDKPQPKREIAISYKNESVRHIVFNATADAASELAEFGMLYADAVMPSGYSLFVDARFDFKEVLQYIESLCPP